MSHLPPIYENPKMDIALILSKIKLIKRIADRAEAIVAQSEVEIQLFKDLNEDSPDKSHFAIEVFNAEMKHIVSITKLQDFAYLLLDSIREKYTGLGSKEREALKEIKFIKNYLEQIDKAEANMRQLSEKAIEACTPHLPDNARKAINRRSRRSV